MWEAEHLQQFLNDFIDEARERLIEWEELCFGLQDGAQQELFDSLFRVAHNLKGSSQSVQLREFGSFVHVIEDTITLLRDGSFELNDDVLGLLFDSHSSLATWLDSLPNNPSEDELSKVELLKSQFTKIVHPDGVENKVEDESLGFGFFEDPQEESPTPDPENSAEPNVAQSAEKPTQQADQQKESSEKQDTAKQKSRDTVRVQAEKLDDLIQLVGELSIHQTIVSHSHSNGTQDSMVCKKAVSQCEKIVADIQHHTLGLRMQPLDGLFKRLKRIAFDIARKQKKDIKVDILGDDVELDKIVIEKVTEPLVHIVRNAVDHGIESPDERVEKNKKPQGVITLAAYQEANEVKITLGEDGRGLDPKKILAKAKEKGLVSEGESNLTSQQIKELILMPGFSTAKEITDVSGRGVGMDVVQSVVSRIGGSLGVKGELNKGTIFEVNLPTTLSILDALIIRVEGINYAVPVQDLFEIIDLKKYSIQRTEDKSPVVNIRGTTSAVQKMESFLPIFQEKSDGDHESRISRPGLVTYFNGKPLTLEVDEVILQQPVVVRKLHKSMEEAHEFSGTTILGNGEPGIILNLPNIARNFFMKVYAKGVDHVI